MSSKINKMRQMKIKNLKLSNFRSYEDFEIDFDKKLNIIVVENSVAKTTIFDAIVLIYGSFFTRLPKINGKNIEDSDIKIIEENRKSLYTRIQCTMYNEVVRDRTKERYKSKETKKLISRITT